jgi:hypothetical protein
MSASEHVGAESVADRPEGTFSEAAALSDGLFNLGDYSMGRYLLLWLLGVPIPILILIWAFGGLH